MRYITERELRDALAGGAGPTYAVPSGAKLTPAAREYLADLKIREVAEEAPAAPSAPSAPAPPSAPSAPAAPSAPSAPAAPSAPGAGVKPEHMTHLTPGELVAKTHPRIALRGKLDALEAEMLVVQVAAGERGEASLIAPLNDALQLTRRVLGSEVTGKALGGWTLGGMTPEAVRAASHRPQDYGFAGHVLPDASQGWAAAQLNRLRALSREAELAANRAFCDGRGGCARVDLVLALNRLSSFFYVLQLEAIRRRG